MEKHLIPKQSDVIKTNNKKNLLNSLKLKNCKIFIHIINKGHHGI